MKRKLLIAIFIFTFSHLYAQNVGIGIDTPQAKLHVNGDFKLKNGVAVNAISSDSSFAAGSDSILPTQKAVKQYIQKGSWFTADNVLVPKNFSSANLDNPGSVFVLGNYAYVASRNNNRLCIYDVSDPANIIAKGFTNTNIISPLAVYVQGNYAYVISDINRFGIYDVSDPNNIVFKSFVSISNPWSVYVKGNYAYVLSITGGLLIYDISNPVSILAKGTSNENLSFPFSIAIQGNYAYIASRNNNRLCIFDISDPVTIVAKGFTSANMNSPLAVSAKGNYAYVLSFNSNQLSAYDISDPNNIVARGFTNANMLNPQSIHVQGNYAYVASSNNSRLCVYDISNPDNLVAKGFTSTNLSIPWAVYAQGGYIYVTSANNNRLCTYSYIQATGAVSYTSSGNLSVVPATWESGNSDNVFRSNGNVGIGVSNPVNRLDVAGKVTVGAGYAGVSVAPANGLLVEGDIHLGANINGERLIIAGGISVDVLAVNDGGLDEAIRFGNAFGTGFGSEGIGSKRTAGGNQNGLNFFTNNTSRMAITNAGFVGIGTSNPAVPLDVAIQNNINVGSYGYLNAVNPTGLTSNASAPVSIKASARVVAQEFNANSDRRIKRNISGSSPQSDLQTLLKLRVANYQLTDSIYNGNTPVKGFIAQELETVMPQAVHTNADYIPDIYCLSTATQYNEKNKTLKISLCKPHQLKMGDKVKVFAGDGMQEQYVTAIDNETTFTLNNWEIKQAGMNPVEKVFVWGKWVTDFHTVDYNQVFSLGISAIQELAKENDELKTKTESLQQQIDALKEMIMKKTK